MSRARTTSSSGLPELVVDGLADGDARALLEIGDHRAARRAGPRPDRRRDPRQPAGAAGAAAGLTAAELAGGFALPDAQPLASQIEQSFVRRLASLPAATRRLLLVAAAEPIGDVTPAVARGRAARDRADAAAPAEAAGLIEFGARVRFRHPLVRSAAYRAATSTDRREAHRALAEATDPDTDPDRRAWHRAHAAAGPTRSWRDELERSADRAQARGGVAAAAAFLARATELTPDPGRRGPRALAAAQAKFEAGAPDAALDAARDRRDRARSTSFSARGSTGSARRSSSRADAAATRRRCCSTRPNASSRSTPRWPARRTSKRSERRSSPVASSDGDGVQDAAEAARARASGTALATSDRPAAGRPRDAVHRRLRRGRRAAQARAACVRRAVQPDGDDDMRWLWLACPVAPSRSRPTCGTTRRGTTWPPARSGWLATPARSTSSPSALTYRAVVHVHAGEFDAASASDRGVRRDHPGDREHARSGTRRCCSPPGAATSPRRRELIATGVRDATARGEGRAIGLARLRDRGAATTASASTEDALAAARRACEHDDLGFYGWALAELVEAGARSGEHEVAAAALAGSRNGPAPAARTGPSASRPDRARSWPATAGRRTAVPGGHRAARPQPDRRAPRPRPPGVRRVAAPREPPPRRARAAAHRARDVRRHRGGGVRRARPPRAAGHRRDGARSAARRHADQLTAQEAQIARLAADGQTNPEIGAAAVHQPPHRRVPPAQGVHQARHQLAEGASRCAEYRYSRSLPAGDTSLIRAAISSGIGRDRLARRAGPVRTRRG